MLGIGGNGFRQLPRARLCILDNGLPPAIAEALDKVGYSFTSVQGVFGTQNPGTPDFEIIEWCSEHDAAWFTADLKARKQFKQQLSDSGIPVVWIQQPKQGLLKREFFLRIVWYLERVLTELENESGLHFEITKAGRFCILE